MSDIKEKFGTDWIGTGSGQSADEDRPRSGASTKTRGTDDDPAYGTGTGEKVNPAFLTLGKQMIRFLRRTQDVDKLYNLADKMMLGPDDLAPVVEWLARNYYIRVVPDSYGNHEIRLTGRASELA